MSEKCWCGRAVAQLAVRITSAASSESVMGCPVHGEDCVWRPCNSRGDWRGDEGRGEFCRCEALGLVFSREVCARCPVPALVEAVRTVVYILESRDKPTGHGPAADAAVRRSDEHIGTFIRKNADIFTKALALLPKGG